MKQLKEYYKNSKKNIQKILFVVWIVLYLIFSRIDTCLSDCINQCATNGTITQGQLAVIELLKGCLLDFIAPATIVYGIYKKAIKYIDEKRWKKKYPELDISGVWDDRTKYTQFLDINGLSDINTENSELSPVIIEQTCREIKIGASIGDGFKWYSVLCGWDDEQLDILYAVEYFATLQDKGYPEKRYGYESMCIDKKELQPKQRPNKMVGKFWHCCSADGKPIYMGEVMYERNIE